MPKNFSNILKITFPIGPAWSNPDKRRTIASPMNITAIMLFFVSEFRLGSFFLLRRLAICMG